MLSTDQSENRNHIVVTAPFSFSSAFFVTIVANTVSITANNTPHSDHSISSSLCLYSSKARS